jgi:hypothetical protein
MVDKTAPKDPAPILTGSGALLRSLEILGIKDVFGLPGGAIMPFYDELMTQDQDSPHPRSSRAGCRPRCRGLRAGRWDRSVCASRRADPAQRTSSRQSLMPTWIRFP